jgi:hypothetical protein
LIRVKVKVRLKVRLKVRVKVRVRVRDTVSLLNVVLFLYSWMLDDVFFTLPPVSTGLFVVPI